MSVTILAIVFLLFILFIAIIGYQSITKRVSMLNENKMEECSICKKKFDKYKLIERQINDHRILRFCKSCVQDLYAQSTNQQL